jgi:hypothetical protein
MWRGAAIISAALLCAAPAIAAADPICPDRPGKGTATCTVPAGHWQVETGLIDWTHDRAGGFRSDFTVIGSTLIKYGISGRADIELGIVPFEIFRVRGGGVREHASGFGYMVARVKYRLTADDAPVAVAIDPFVKIPTANRRLGNGKVEAGLTVPVSAALGNSPVSLALTSELGWFADGDGRGHHAAFSQVVGLGFAASSRLSLSAELWGAWDWDPDVTGKQVSANGSAAYLASDTIQLDAGANFGLNRQTPDIQIYAGVSKRF